IKAHEKSVVKEKSLTEKSVLDFIVERLKPLFEPAGFVWNKKEEWAERTVAYGTQRLWLGVEKKRDAFDIYYSARFNVSAVTEAVRRLNNDPLLTTSINCTHYTYFANQFLPPKVRNANELEKIMESIEESTKTTVLPFFEANLDLEKLTSAINNPEKCRYFISTFLVEALSLAYLVQPSKIQETADIYRNYIRYRNYPEENITKIDKLVNQLIALNPTL
ncbi:hypothetical protein, partial [Undibacterium rugosum]|uniref:hypothetical protein n=1 Tax=Undibacterium rugosum TaxID=2762291 RepID=UPI001B8297B8